MNNAAQQLKCADNLTELWKGLFPEDQIPDRTQFLTWAGMCSEETAAFAFNRAARKARNQKQAGTPLDGNRLGRYITGIIRNEREGRHIFNNERRNIA